jgi:methionyl-tRNA formyltransferase
VVVDNPDSWFMPFARRLVHRLGRLGESSLLSSSGEIPQGSDIAYLLSSELVVSSEVLARSRHTIVVHASALPKGRGMSPLAWQVLEGRNRIPVTLFEAVEKVDAGPIYLSDAVTFNGTELLAEMQASLGAKIVSMCVRFARDAEALVAAARPQRGTASYYARRTKADSRLDPKRSIASQFDLLRVVDNRRYPAFFEWRGRRYVLRIEAADEQP